MLRTLTLFGIAALVVTPTLAQNRGDDKSRADDKPAKIEGTYTITKGERDGKALDESRFKGAVTVITKDKIVSTDKDKKELYVASYKLERDGKMWKIMMTSIKPNKGEKADGVVKVDGDTLMLCYALPDGKTPTGFKTGEKQQCFTLKKVKTKSDR